MLKPSQTLHNHLEKIPGDDLNGVKTFDPVVDRAAAEQSTLWEVRTEEQPYAFLSDPTVEEKNRYGQKIDLLDLSGLPAERSLYINDNPEVGANPNRNKQHGFFFTADNCIGCHACEAACAEKNETPAHLAFRSVGYVEGGSFPDYQRLNISMACNHCDDPVCLKGCPTRAYTKHAEYGAVLQDPDTCFGCGYCTWVCPYNAPQLDPIEGQVSKCNMCVDRLEVGLKPACVSACVGNALDFGVIENVPHNREQAEASIPGFPDPTITHPNIRFQQTRGLPDEMKRTDSAPVKYRKAASGRYEPVVDRSKDATTGGSTRHWNLARLSSRENPLVLFTLATQAAVGTFALAFLGDQFGIEALVRFNQGPAYVLLATLSWLLAAGGLFMSTLHLGKPLRFYRGFNNLRHSPVCREGLGIALFLGALALHILFSLPANGWIQSLYAGLFGAAINTLIAPATAAAIAAAWGALAIAGGLAGLYYMNRCYRIKARPFWDHWQVASSFFGTALSLGALLGGAVMIAALALEGAAYSEIILLAGTVLSLGLAIEGLGLLAHARAMNAAQHEGAASHYVQRTTFGNTYRLRNLLLGTGLLAAVALVISGASSPWALAAWGVLGAALLAASAIGRALFYVLVIPTTMPGAFFWKNKGFEEHARAIGLAAMPQVGVVPQGH
ncbi:4Fe-4S dicluster domain-containing protein [Exilibacterium tricleocarpae]|uniref:4Fe-4S dicluster domain-containing protein n=1 Tax=Exilibacterium tricleocarpae TaxID=2591008 RepID=A0A545U5F4_9GAMM|nr:DmsC/YnfH family molybdoenzyme membrane anchor subunit [Exilibacterium tricleocarpae]TQV84698.1 4Fe-4S dicluster domain-containing protein [Exilibacterium tricleocarpae]